MQHSKRNSDCTIIIAIGHCPFHVVLIVLQLVETVSDAHQNILLWYSPNSEPQRHACRASRTATTWCVAVYCARLTCSRIILESFQTWKREGETTQLNHCHERTSSKVAIRTENSSLGYENLMHFLGTPYCCWWLVHFGLGFRHN